MYMFNNEELICTAEHLTVGEFNVLLTVHHITSV
jgi:hypothetical protein